MKKKDCFFKIIIPNYNNEKYLDNCLRSIIRQNFTDFFVVIIDDLSTDNSKEIIMDWTKKDKRIHSIFLNEKKWNGGARNIGLNTNPIKSKYTLFIDSDDEFDNINCLKDIYNIIINNNYPDCVRLSYNWCGDEKRAVTLNQNNPKDLVNDCNVACWTKCIKTDKIVPFPENTLMEDVVQHIAQCDIIDTIVPCLNPIINWNRNNPHSCSTNGELQNCKWLSSMYRYCADLMDLQCEKDYCEDHRLYRLNQTIDNIKNNISSQ